MKITSELLKAHNACEDQVELFRIAYPNGLETTVENAIRAEEEGFDVIWCVRLLPHSGQGSFVEFALWCAQQVVHLTDDPHVAECLEIVAKEIENPGSQDMIAASSVANAAANAAYAANATTYYSARAAAYAAWASWAAADAAENAENAAWAAYYSARATESVAYDASYIFAKEGQIAMLSQMLGEA